MGNEEMTTEKIAEALINLHESEGLCDKDTATGFKSSKKKDILKSKQDGSFSKFTNEIKKRQEKKE